MKKLILSILILLPFISLAQDKIHFADGRIQNVKVIEVGIEEIRYKKSSNLQGPNYVALKKSVLRIEYENGSVDYFEVSDKSKKEETPNHYEVANKKDLIEEPVNLRTRYPNGFSGVLLGPTVIGSLQYDLFLNENWNFDLGIGLVGIYAGMSYHFGGKKMEKKATPFLGLKGTLGISSRDLEAGPGIYVPMGINIITKDGFVVAPHVAMHAVYVQTWMGPNEIAVLPFVGLKMGIRFK